MLKKKETYKKHWECNASPSKMRIGYDAKYERLNDLVWQWFCVVRAKNMPLSGPIIKEKALQFAQELGITEYKASNGWLDKWKERHSIKEFKVSGESAGVDTDVVKNFKSQIPEIIGDYSLDDVFNCDETGLYFRALPDKMLSVKGTASKGTKVSKDRITVMFACSASGEKLRPLVITKVENPRCFKNVKKTELGVKYVANKKAWMNNKVFTDWLVDLNSDMRRQGRKILMLLDNASSHGKQEYYTLSNVEIKFLPANTTSQLQQLDQGIIRTFKACYRKSMLRSLFSKMDSAELVTELCKTVSLLDAFGWVVKAWDSVKTDTVVKCFKSSGFSSTHFEMSSDNLVNDDEFDDDDVPLNVLVQQFRYTCENFDHDVPTEDNSDEWECNLVQSFKESSETTCDVCDTETDDVQQHLPGSELTHSEVLEMLIKIKNFATENDSDYLNTVQELQMLTERKIVKAKWVQKQSTIDSFFKKSDA
ncbi:tigger transposable element-derived protein 6-like [Ruditapes philippinarum]|uniref:tigger transposable element-derived protein 6-like n=1 Tax=Ruditapes philippinarum TaxID=129788 RepID=UPI00295AD158|nr:tigger transposable element-derived protein 6-like [Ruditapes philippinarum]